MRRRGHNKNRVKHYVSSGGVCWMINKSEEGIGRRELLGRRNSPERGDENKETAAVISIHKTVEREPREDVSLLSRPFCVLLTCSK